MFELKYLLLYIPALPLLGALLAAIFGGVKELRKFAHVPVVLCAALSCGCALTLLVSMASYEADVPVFPAAGEHETFASPYVWFGMTTEKTKLVVEFSLAGDQLT